MVQGKGAGAKFLPVAKVEGSKLLVFFVMVKVAHIVLNRQSR